jgi:hypothetical protein
MRQIGAPAAAVAQIALQIMRVWGNNLAVLYFIATSSQGPKLFVIIFRYHSIFGQLFRGFFRQICKIQIF